MVIFAHPDDAEIGSGGVMARWVAAGCEVTYVLCTNGSAGTADRVAVGGGAGRQAGGGAARGGGLHGREEPGDAPLSGRRARGHPRVPRRHRARDPHLPAAHGVRSRSRTGCADFSTATTGWSASSRRMRSTRSPATICTFPSTSSTKVSSPTRCASCGTGAPDEPDVIVDVTASIDKQIAALIRHESQVPGFNVPDGQSIGERVKRGAADLARGYGFKHGAAFRRLIARR